MDILGNLQKVISFVFRAGKSTVTIQGAADLKSQDPGKDIVINVRDGALDQNLVTDSSIDTLTNKTIDSASNTITIDADLATVSNIDDDNIRAGGVGTVSMADDAVTNDKIATDAVNADSIADNAIDTAAIQNGAVTDAKITAVDSTKATYSNVSSGLVATNVQAAIDEVEGRVDASETALSDHLLDAIDAHDASAISFDPSSNSLTATELQTLGAEIATRLDTADTNISNNDTDITNLQNDKADKSTAINTTGSLTGGGDLSTSRTLDVADGGIDTTELADDSVTKEKINPDVAGVGLGQNVDGSLEVNVDDSTIETNVDTLRVKSSGITANELANDSVDAAAIQTDAVTTDKILNSNVTGDKIASNAITVAKIADGAISDAKVNDVGANKITGSFPEFYLDSGSTAIVANVITLPADASHFTVTGGGPLNNITSVGSLTDRYFQLQNTSGGAISITNGSGIITGTGANLTWEDEATLIFYNNGTDNVICGGSGSGTGGGIATVFVTHSTIPATLEVDKRYLVDISGGNATASMPASSALNDGKVIEVWPVNNPGGGTVTLNAAASHNFNDPDLGSDSQYILDVGSAEFVIRDTGDLYEVRDAYWSAGFDLQEASASQAGIVSTGAQTFAGDKTFTGNVDAASYTGLPVADGATAGVVSTGSQTIAGDKTFTGNVDANSYTGLPVASDTVAGIISRYDSGTYTPSIVKGPTGSVVNTTTIRKAFFEVINDRVKVSIYVSLSLSTAGTGDQDFDITVPSSYPIASGSYNAVGTITNNTSIFKSGIIRSAGNTTEVLASFVKDSGNTGTVNYCILFEYNTTA